MQKRCSRKIGDVFCLLIKYPTIRNMLTSLKKETENAYVQETLKTVRKEADRLNKERRYGFATCFGMDLTGVDLMRVRNAAHDYGFELEKSVSASSGFMGYNLKVTEKKKATWESEKVALQVTADALVASIETSTSRSATVPTELLREEDNGKEYIKKALREKGFGDLAFEIKNEMIHSFVSFPME